MVKKVIYGFSEEGPEITKRIMGDTIGGLVSGINEALSGSEMTDAATALAVVLAFTIDSNDNKQAAYEAIMDEIERMVSFDKPPFRGKAKVQ